MARKTQIKKIAILTGGGDCPGLNAVIRSVTRTAITNYGWKVEGILDGFEGLVKQRTTPLDYFQVSGFLTRGGTYLGSCNKVNPFMIAKPAPNSSKQHKIFYEDASHLVMDFFKKGKFDALVCVGGDGTMSFAARFAAMGMPIIGIPKTIDNDVPGTELTVGFETAVAIAAEAIERLHSTAESHHRVMVVEIMGRDAGWLTLASGLAGGADVILIPEIEFDLKKIYAKIEGRTKKHRRYTIISVAEGARMKDGKQIVKRRVADVTQPNRLGGIADWLVEKIEANTGRDARAVVLGHVLRGGSPIPGDRLLATHFGYEAVHRLADGEKGRMVCWQAGQISSLPLTEIAKTSRKIPKDHHWLGASRATGATFGGEDD